MNTNGIEIANNIRAERNRANLTQEETANAIGITTRTYLTYETDAKNIGATILGKLANLFNCNINAFYVPNNFTKSEINNKQDTN